MESIRWFVLVDGQIIGPMSQDEVSEQIGHWKEPLIWGRGQAEWLSPEKWTESLKTLGQTLERGREFADRTWKLLIDDKEMGPYLHEQMISILKNRPDYKEIRIWTEGYSDWKEVYQIHKLMDELGVSRRVHPRVPVMGFLELDSGSLVTSAKLLSISEGGLGTLCPSHLRIGDKFRSIIKSPNFVGPIHCTTEVVYSEPNGYTGLKFLSLPSESRVTIVEYVNKFAGEKP